MCLALLLLCNAVPMDALAAAVYGPIDIVVDEYANPDDVIRVVDNVAETWVKYIDQNNRELAKYGISLVGKLEYNSELGCYEHTVETYEDLGEAVPTGFQFVQWKVVEVKRSGDKATSVELQACIEPITYTIGYQLPDGTGLPSDVVTTLPSSYTHGTELDFTMASATWEGVPCTELYSDPELNIRVTSIPTTATGNRVLYAKFEAPINYNVNTTAGESNSPENPTTYIYGKGISAGGIGNATKNPTSEYTFDGWYNADTKVTSISTSQRGAVNLTAKFTAKTYTITYLLPNGNTVLPEVTNGLPTQYTYGTMTEIEMASGALSNAYNGVVCTGWYKDAALTTPVTAISNTESEDVKLYGKFEAGLTYEPNGGTNDSTNPSTYTYGKGVASFRSASKFGYTFADWYTDSGFAESTRVTGIAAMETGAKTLYAKYTPNSWNIEYNGNGGTVLNSGSTARYVYGEGISGADPNLTATKDNYDFAGWYMTPACTDGTKWEDVCNAANGYKLATSYLPDTTAGKIMLYAKYTPKTYTITYKLPDGSALPTGVVPSGLESNYVYGVGRDLSAASAVWEGVSCAGWYRDTELLTPVTAISPEDSGDLTLYAKFAWDIRYHNVDGGAVHTNPGSYVYGVGVSRLADAEKTGYDFAGWFTEESCAEESRVTSVAASETGELHLYAKFTPATYAIHYVLNGGINDTANPVSYTYGDGVAAFGNAAKTGCNFAGWYSDEAFAYRVSSIPDTRTGEITLYAKYEAVDYAITYETNGGTNSVNNPAGYRYGTGVGSFEPAVKAGHIFGGWYRSGDFSGEPAGSIPATETGAVTLYAKFDAADYAIAYVTNGGSDPATNPRGYQYGTEISGFADSVKQNYRFDGWYANADFSGNPITAISAGDTGDKILYAKFTPDSYTITYVLNDGGNAETNPSGYTYGAGVQSFADAVRQGYTFGGWFTDPAFAELSRVTSLSEGHTGDVTLYAKFTENPAAPVPTPTPEPKTITPPAVPVSVPVTGDSVLGICLAAVLLVSGCGLLVIVWIRKRERDNAA